MTDVLRRGCDSYSHASPATMKPLGLTFAMRYVGMGSGKLLTSAEVQALHGAGIDILLNPEMDTTDGSGGFAQGVRYATIANDHADSLGAPQTAVLVYSIDADRTADWVRPYFQGIKSVGRRKAGGYGGTEMVTMLDEGLITVWVQANAGSWSGWRWQNGWVDAAGNRYPPSPEFPVTHSRAHLRQHLATTALGFNYDPEDQMQADCGFWLSPYSNNPSGDDLTPDQSQQLQELHDLFLKPVDQVGAGVPWAANQTLLLTRIIANQVSQLVAVPPGSASITTADIEAIVAAVVPAVLQGLRDKPLAPVA